MDHVEHGPVCKHAGAVSYALASGQREKTEQFPAQSASDWILSPELRARGADDRRASEPLVNAAA
eukprot:1973018-Alexandrium_andersonii.AAC.1